MILHNEPWPDDTSYNHCRILPITRLARVSMEANRLMSRFQGCGSAVVGLCICFLESELIGPLLIRLKQVE